MGAWGTYYRAGVGYKSLPSINDEAVMQFYAVRAIKAELAYRGYDGKMALTSGFFGSGADKQSRLFQDAMSITVDGVVGPITSRLLFKARVGVIEQLQHIPDRLLCKIIALESAYDPGAIGSVDPQDHGLLQINLKFHPDLTEAQTATPSFAITWGGKALAAAFGSLGDWDAAVASWNVGYVAARTWLNAGKPDDGSTASKYVKLVRAQAC